MALYLVGEDPDKTRGTGTALQCRGGSNGTDRARTDHLLRVKRVPQPYLIGPPLFERVPEDQN
jgi:hypothetical protein